MTFIWKNETLCYKQPPFVIFRTSLPTVVVFNVFFRIADNENINSIWNLTKSVLSEYLLTHERIAKYKNLKIVVMKL